MGTYAWNILYFKILPAKSRTWRRRPTPRARPVKPYMGIRLQALVHENQVRFWQESSQELLWELDLQVLAEFETLFASPYSGLVYFYHNEQQSFQYILYSTKEFSDISGILLLK